MVRFVQYIPVVKHLYPQAKRTHGHPERARRPQNTEDLPMLFRATAIIATAMFLGSFIGMYIGVYIPR